MYKVVASPLWLPAEVRYIQSKRKKCSPLQISFKKNLLHDPVTQKPRVATVVPSVVFNAVISRKQNNHLIMK